jgi:hypothetical protein
MRRDLRRVRHWIRGLVLAAIAMLGLVAIVGSGGGGGSLLPEPCTSPSCFPPAWEVTVEPAYITALVGTPVVFKAETSNAEGAVSYQWCVVAIGSNTCQAIAGATGPSYSIAAVNLADDGTTIQVDVQASNGSRFAVSRLAVSATPGLVFEDREFQPADWIVSPVVGPSSIAPAHSEERVDSGGNPGAFRKMVFDVPQGTSPQYGAYVAYLSPSSSYDPAAQGAIHVIDYAEDCIILSPASTRYVEPALLIEQGGRTYVPNRYTDWCILTTWSAVGSHASLRTQDFRLFDGPACGVGEACPDFSSGGLPIRFGYLRAAQTSPGDSVAHGIDNWKVTVWRR